MTQASAAGRPGGTATATCVCWNPPLTIREPGTCGTTARSAARRMAAEEAEEIAELESVPATELSTLPGVPVKRGRGRPRGSRTRNRTSPLNGSAALLDASAHPAGDEGADGDEAEKDKEKV